MTSAWARLATGPKMLLILALALLPLGLVAIWASVYNARQNSAERAEQTLARLDDKAERLEEAIARGAATIRAANSVVAAFPSGEVCENVLRRLASVQLVPGRYALLASDGTLRCATPGFAPRVLQRGEPLEQVFDISGNGETLRLTLYDQRGSPDGVMELTRQALSDLTLLPGTRADFTLELLDGNRRMTLRDDYRPVPLVQTVSDTAPIAGNALQLRIQLPAVPIRPLDVLLILLPVVMWVAAAIIGWWVVNRLLLRPLAQIQRVVASYHPGDRPIELPRLRSPAREIGELGLAFDRVTRTVARHEADLEAAVERQTRLVREVHHRVKNNLQVVASLLNLHSRGSTSEEAAAAYASIQRRVDALAVVHRNHYAELEENRGVSLRPLVSELTANLRATAPADAAAMQIRLDIASIQVGQDVAVSVAFLITEVTEYGMLCGARRVTIVVEPEEPGRARLAIEVDSLADKTDGNEALSDRFERIITGLARQLRSSLEREPDRGRYSVVLAVIDRPVEPAD